MTIESISVLVPVFNEAASIESVLSELARALGETAENFRIIVIDDGSNDGTAELLARLEKELPNLRILRHASNLGLGAALRTGLQNVDSAYWTWLPGDGEVPPSELKKLIAAAAENSVAVTYFPDAAKVRSRFRNGLSLVYRFALRRFFGHDVRYFNGPALYPRSAQPLIDLHSTGFSAPAEILLQVLDQGFDHKDVPLRLAPRAGGQSKAISVPVFANLLVWWTKIWWSRRVWSGNVKNPHRKDGQN